VHPSCQTLDPMDRLSSSLEALDRRGAFRSQLVTTKLTVAEALSRLESRRYREFPQELRKVLSIHHSPIINGPSCDDVFNAALSLEVLNLYPEWEALQLVPLGSDGCGNYFVAHVGARAGCPLLFIVTSTDHLVPSYVVASSVDSFLAAILAEQDWFDIETVRRNDPAMLSLVEYPMPWQE
jgi:hypothetical protein